MSVRGPRTSPQYRAQVRGSKMRGRPGAEHVHSDAAAVGIVVNEVTVDAAGRKRRAVRMDRRALFGLAGRVRAALRGQGRADCIVYDAAGKPIAKIDGETRVRRRL